MDEKPIHRNIEDKDGHLYLSSDYARLGEELILHGGEYESAFGRLTATGALEKLNGWYIDERGRGTHVAVICHAARQLYLSIIVSAIASSAPAEIDRLATLLVVGAIQRELPERLATTRKIMDEDNAGSDKS